MGIRRTKYTAIFKYVSLAVYLFALITCTLLLFVFGISTMMTTALAYSAFCVLTINSLSLIQTGSNKKAVQNLKVFALSVFLALFSGELALKYLFRLNLTYNEIHGSFYISEYKKAQKQNYRWKNIFKNPASWNKTKAPNSSRIIERDNFRFTHHYNSLGLRDVELASINRDSARIVLGIGDSFTEGVGAQQDSTWLKFFERQWNGLQHHPPVKTFNAGISGSDVYYEYHLLIKLLDQVQPAIVILAINESDLDEYLIRGGMERFKPGGRVSYNPAPWWESIYAVSFIARAAINSFYHPDWTLLTREQKEIKNKSAMDSIETCVRSFSQLALEHHFKLIVVFDPLEEEVRTQKMAFDPLVLKLQSDTSLCVLNLLEEFKSTGIISPGNASGSYWPTDFHNNAKGYKVWGDIVSKYIQQKGILK